MGTKKRNVCFWSKRLNRVIHVLLQHKWLLCGFNKCPADADYINLLWANPKSEGSLSSQLVLVKRIGLRLALLCVRLMSSHSLTLSTFTAITVSLADKRTQGCQKVGPWFPDHMRVKYVCVGVCVCYWSKSHQLNSVSLLASFPWLGVLIPYLETEGNQVHISERWCNLSAVRLCFSRPNSHSGWERLLFPSCCSSFFR